MGSLTRAIDVLNNTVGKAAAWLALFMVMTEFVVVVMRYVFGIGSQYLQESALYMFGMMFLLAAGYTLRNDSHVRIDILYGKATPRRKAQIDLFGTIFFLIPVCLQILWASTPFVINSWASLEGSLEGTGLPIRFILKSFIPIFAVLVILQGIALAIRAILVIMGRESDHIRKETVGF